MQPVDVTAILEQVNAGEAGAQESLLAAVYDELRAVSAKRLAGERANHTLQPTELAHEAYLRLVRQRTDWRGRAHFFAIAARTIRRILVDHARRRRSQRRDATGGADLGQTLCATQSGELDLLELEDVLTKFAAVEPRAAQVVEMRFFCDLSDAEIAHVLGVTERTVQRDWVFARAWLHREIGDRDEPA